MADIKEVLDVTAPGVMAHKMYGDQYIIFYVCDRVSRVAYAWPTEDDGVSLKRVSGYRKPDAGAYWRLDPEGEIVYVYDTMTEAEYNLRSFMPDEPARMVCVWKEETAVKDVLACDLATLEKNREKVSSMIPNACCENCRRGLRAMATAYKKYAACVRRNDRDETHWRRCAELCSLVGDHAGHAAAEKRANKLAAMNARPASAPSAVERSEERETPPPRRTMSAAAKKHAAALKKHGEGSRQEARARRAMLDFEAIISTS